MVIGKMGDKVMVIEKMGDKVIVIGEKRGHGEAIWENSGIEWRHARVLVFLAPGAQV